MAKKQKAIRGKFADEKYLGAEPDLRGKVSNAELINAYNWYNYFYDNDKAKEFVLAFMKEFKFTKEQIKNVTRADADRMRNLGWNCRILLLGGKLPTDIAKRVAEKLRILGEAGVDGEDGLDREHGDDNGRNEAEEASQAAREEEPAKRVISIQERIINRANDLIADIEIHLDNYYRDGTAFKPVDWLIQNDVKPQIAQRIADYYKPLYSEAFDALNGKDEQLKEGYSHYKKPKLKAYVEFLRGIISAAETRATIVKATRKPRKKKEKPASVIVAKLKFKEKDETYNLTSVDPKQIVGCNQLWVFNSKYRTLAVYNAMGPAGLNVKGSTITGFDEKTSVVKKLRKPAEQVNKLLEGGKVVLRKFMDDIKCKPKTANGRINNETVLVRIIK